MTEDHNDWVEQYRRELEAEVAQLKQIEGCPEFEVKVEHTVTVTMAVPDRYRTKTSWRVTKGTGTGRGYRTPRKMKRQAARILAWRMNENYRYALRNRIDYQEYRANNNTAPAWYMQAVEREDVDYEALNTEPTAMERIANPRLAATLARIKRLNDDAGRPLELTAAPPVAARRRATSSSGIRFVTAAPPQWVVGRDQGEDLPTEGD